MPEFAFDVVAAEPDRFGAAPTMLFKLRIAETSGDPVHSMMLRTQVQIDAQLRTYNDDEKERLGDLFGDKSRWGDTLRPFNWTHGSIMISGFRGSTEIDVPVPCTYDFDVAAAKFMAGLDDGVIPLSFLYSGTAISRGATGYSVTQIPWHKESTFPLPVSTWRALMDTFFPGTGWIRVHRDTLEQLRDHRRNGGFNDWDAMLTAMMQAADGATK